ncbi:hypothetical protein ACFYQT_40100 [Streptomyces tibetensis]|uniref:Terminase small subunit n=1 Tax=Streptomyces tibetensis TaxID=2382123 RepID=A0ABW6N8X8_9ACTN
MAWSAAKIAEVDERRTALIKLRRKRVPYDDPRILALGYSNEDVARKDFYRAVTARRKATEAEVADYRAEQSQIISDLLDTYLPLALGSDEAGPDHKAGEMVLKLLERDARLNGWEAALKAELSGPGGGAVPIRAATISELHELIRTAGEPDQDEDLDTDTEDGDENDDGHSA